MRRRVIVAAAVVLAGMSPGIAQRVPAPVPPGQAGRGPNPAAPAAAKGTGLILGRVIEAAAKQPIPRAMVTLATHRSDLSSSERVPAASTGAFDAQGRIVAPSGVAASPTAPPPSDVSFRATVECTADGQFVFSDIPAGHFDLSARSSGFGGPPVILDVGTGQRIGDASIVLTRAVTIGGRVLDEAGDPIVGVDVQVLPRRLAVNGDFDSRSDLLRTDDRGMYRLVDAAPGDYTALVTSSYVTSGNQMPDVLAVLGGGLSTSGLASRLSATGSFHVGNAEIQPWGPLARLVPPPAPGARLRVYPSTFAPDAITPSAARIVSLPPGAEQLDVDIHPRLIETYRVSGRLSAPSGPVSHEIVRLIPDGGSTVTSVSGTTDPLGRFTILGVFPGHYTIAADRAWIDHIPLAISRPLTVGANDVDGIDLVLRRQQ